MLIKSTVLFFAFLMSANIVFAAPYGQYDLKSLVIQKDGKTTFDVQKFGQILGDLDIHAAQYPPKFDSKSDQERATRDAAMLSNMMDVLVDAPNPNPDLLLRTAFLNSIAHNLDVAGAAQKASAQYKQFLVMYPTDPKANYLYGLFLVGSGNPKESIAPLSVAQKAGMAPAEFALGFAYLSLGEQKTALSYFESYQRKVPSDTRVAELIGAVKAGKVEFKSK
jgi:TolA-binding protein